MTGKTCLRQAGILGLPVTMTGNICQILIYIQRNYQSDFPVV